MSLLLPGQCYLCADVLSAKDLSRCLCDACIADLPLSPPSCIYCAELVPSAKQTCHVKVLESSAVDYFISQYHYQNPVSFLIKQLKYNNGLLLAHFFGESLGKHVLTINQPLPEILIAIPLHPKRLRVRGYNQALEIAKVVARGLNIPLVTSVLVRSRYTVSQTECSMGERQTNLSNSFAVSGALTYTSVALIDDVLTTGATLREAGKALKAAGVKHVYGWCCAQSGNS